MCEKMTKLSEAKALIENNDGCISLLEALFASGEEVTNEDKIEGFKSEIFDLTNENRLLKEKLHELDERHDDLIDEHQELISEFNVLDDLLREAHKSLKKSQDFIKANLSAIDD